MIKWKCPCCEKFTLSEPPEKSYEICPECKWEIDPVQIKDPDFEGGANELSLNQARLKYKSENQA